MAIYAIGDLHLSFGTNKPMDIFGNRWINYEEKLKNNWTSTVKEEDTVILLGDFSWGMYLSETKEDFAYINGLPGKKILLKGNHDYWWTTLTNMRKFLEENNLHNIDFLYNNSYMIEDYIIAGTRGWSNFELEENQKIYNREQIRLELSIKDGIQKFGTKKEIMVFTHYPPFFNHNGKKLIEIMKKYNVKRCFYGHLHGESHKDAIQGKIDGIDFKLVSSDYTEFNLVKIS